MPIRKQMVTEYTAEFRAAVLTEYAAGASSFALSRKYGIASGTIERWALKADIQRGSELTERARQDIGSMVTDYLRSNIKAMTAVAEHVADKEWLNNQSAEGLALIVSTLHDKTVHLLSSMQANADATKQLMEQDLTPDGNHLLPSHPDYIDPQALEPVNEMDYDDQTGADLSDTA